MEQVAEITAAAGGGVEPKAPKALAPSGMDADIDAALDAAVENVPEKYREGAGLGKKAEKKEQPKSAKPEQSGDAPADEAEAEPEGEAETGAKSDPETNYALEKALAALRLDGVPSETIDAMLANEKGRSQLLSWGSKVSAKHAAVSEKLKNQAEELKRAEQPKPETTTKAEAASPTADVDFTSTLKAFEEYGPEFQKGQSEFARAIYEKARNDIRGEIQPAAAVLLEMRSLMEEMVGETLRRESGERFSNLVEGEKYDEVQAAFKRLWGDGGKPYKDSAKTLMGRLRACQADACQLVASKTPAPRKDDSETKAQRIPASPARTTPKRALSVDQQVDAAIEQSMKRFAER